MLIPLVGNTAVSTYLLCINTYEQFDVVWHSNWPNEPADGKRISVTTETSDWKQRKCSRVRVFACLCACPTGDRFWILAVRLQLVVSDHAVETLHRTHPATWSYLICIICVIFFKNRHILDLYISLYLSNRAPFLPQLDGSLGTVRFFCVDGLNSHLCRPTGLDVTVK